MSSGKTSGFGKKFGCVKVCFGDAFVYRFPLKTLLTADIAAFLGFLAVFMKKSGAFKDEC